jgi:hypothetical protein
MPGGRPTKYPEGRALDALKSRILNLAREGASTAQIAAETGVPRTTMLTWAKAHPSFAATLMRAKELEQAWWEEQGRRGLLMGTRFNDQVWIRSMQARFPGKYTQRRRFKNSASVTYQVVRCREYAS